MLYGILSSVLYASSQIIDKHMMHYQHLDYKKAVALTSAISVITLSLLGIFVFKINVLEFNFDFFTIALFAALVLTAVFDFMLYFKGLSLTSVSDAQPYLTFSFFFIVIMASVIYPQDITGVNHLIIALIATGVLILSNFERKHLVFSKASIILLSSTFFLALSKILAKGLVLSIDPFIVTIIQIFFMEIALLVILRQSFKGTTKLNWISAFLTNALWILSLFFEYKSYEIIGIIDTVIILSSVPLVATFLDVIILKERLKKRTIFATIVITSCIIYLLLTAPQLASI
ncbi:MAG: DMT family transporter [archaeon]